MSRGRFIKTPKVVHKEQEPYDIDITRNGEWGNPFIVGRDGTRSEVIELHKRWFLSQPELVKQAQTELRGKVLGCWCKPKSCHGDILFKVANADTRFFGRT
jgi:hypothetical protein